MSIEASWKIDLGGLKPSKYWTTSDMKDNSCLTGLYIIPDGEYVIIIMAKKNSLLTYYGFIDDGGELPYPIRIKPQFAKAIGSKESSIVIKRRGKYKWSMAYTTDRGETITTNVERADDRAQRYIDSLKVSMAKIKKSNHKHNITLDLTILSHLIAASGAGDTKEKQISLFMYTNNPRTLCVMNYKDLNGPIGIMRGSLDTKPDYAFDAMADDILGQRG